MGGNYLFTMRLENVVNGVDGICDEVGFCWIALCCIESCRK